MVDIIDLRKNNLDISKQAETVRLQSHIEPGLMKIHLKFTDFRCQEYISKFKI